MIINPYAFGVSYDPDAQAFFTASGLTGATNLTAINNLVIALKGYGIWTKMKAIYPFIGGTAALHKWNLKDPQDTNAAFRLVFNGGWSHASTGATPNGVNGWANTYFNPATNSIVANYNHISYYSRTSAAGSNALNQFYEIGMSGTNGFTSDIFGLYSRRQGDTAAYDCGVFVNNRNSVTNTNGQGFYLGKTNNDLTSKYYKSGTLLGTKSITAQNLASYNVYLGGLNDLNSIIYYSNKQCAFASIGDGLSDTEAANFYTAVQNFNTALNRQVV